MDKWQPIETAPKDGTRILLVDADAEHASSDREICVGWWREEWRDYGDIGCNGEGECWWREEWRDYGDIGCNGEYAPTHWMPLPEAPHV